MSLNKKINPLIAITGLESAGKTTFIHRLKTGEFKSDFQPTVGYDLSIIRKEDFRFDIVDLGGHEAFRTTFWENFVTSCQGCVFVFDRSNKEKIVLAKEWLWKVEKWVPKDANFAFFANKSDLEEIMSLDEIIEGLDLTKFSESPLKSFRIFETSSVTGKNIDECWDWMTKSIKRRMEAKPIMNIYAFELLDDRLEALVQEVLAEGDKKEKTEEIRQVFRAHSLKMIDSLPFINIDNFIVHILKKGDYYAVLYVDKDDEQRIARETGMTLLFESLSRIRRELKVDREFLIELINSIKYEI
ncbi:MAG: GTP-binding protein [Candidatus Heimdallarchaeota archaeon]|nr:GTP-binding protein [Candidatus Heimdallarchaeota archaeon]MCK4955506.1 GTP-binding protein [Candidatus Heimdallarchaeota archaeon]